MKADALLDPKPRRLAGCLHGVDDLARTALLTELLRQIRRKADRQRSVLSDCVPLAGSNLAQYVAAANRLRIAVCLRPAGLGNARANR